MSSHSLADRGPPAAAPAPAPSALAAALAGLAALAVAVGIGRFAFTPILPMMQADAGLSVEAGGWLAAANYAGYLAGAVTAIGMPVAPGVAIRAGLLAIGVTTLAMAGPGGFPMWMALRALAGIASAAVLIFVSAWCLERLEAARRPALASVVFAGVGTGIATAGAACLVLMRREAAAVDAWMALGALSLAVTAVVWPLFKTHGAGRGGPRDAGPAAPRWDGDAVRLVVCYGAWGFGYIIPATFLPAMARARLDDPVVFGWAWPIFGMASVAATVGGGACSRRVGPRRLWRLSQVTMAVGVILPVVWPGIVAIMGAALLVGSTFMVNTMSGMQEARRVHGAGARRLMAAMTAAFAAGQMLGPLAVSALAGDDARFEPALIVAAVVLLAGAGALRSPR